MIWPRARFRTDRLILRPYRRRDAARLPIYLDDWDTARWLSRTPFPYSVQDAHDWIRMSRRILSRGEGYPLAITARSDKVLMGGIGLSLQTGEVGYWLGSQWRGRQFVSEALGKIIEIAFQQHQLPGLVANVLPDNVASRRVLEKQGFREVGQDMQDFRGEAKTVIKYELKNMEGWQAAA